MSTLFGLTCCLYWVALIAGAYPPSASLPRSKQDYAAKLAYKENDAASEEFALDSEDQPILAKSRISDFTDPDTGLNPYLDLSEGPSGVRPKYYKYDRHSKRDNVGPNEEDQPVYGRLRMVEKNPLSSDDDGWDLEARDEPASTNRFQRMPQSEPKLGGPEEFAKPERSPSLTRGFVSVVEGDSGGRRSFWVTPTRSKPTPEVTATPLPEIVSPKVTGDSETSIRVKPTMDYVTVNPEAEKLPSVPDKGKRPKENIVETRSKANSELEDGQSFPEEEDPRPPIAAFLDTKSFVYSLALICASVVFFAAVLTGMFIYRKKRRRLPGVHKKGGRFFFKEGAKNRMGPINRQNEERILPDDFRVTVC